MAQTESNPARVVIDGGINVSAVSVLAILAGAGSVIAVLFRALIKSKDREFAAILADRNRDMIELEGLRASLEEIAQRAVQSAIDTTNFWRSEQHKPPLIIAAPVVPESHSPSTTTQRQAARLQTLRAVMALIAKETGQAPRVESHPEPS